MRVLLAFLLLTVPCYAQDLVVCDPTHPQVPNAVTRFEGTGDWNAQVGRLGFLVWDAPHTLHTPAQLAAFNRLRAQLDSLTGVPVRYWVCADMDMDGVLESVREMTAAEKALADAPEVLATQQRQALLTERTQLSSDVDTALTNWSSLNTTQRIEAQRKGLRLQRVKELLQE